MASFLSIDIDWRKNYLKLPELKIGPHIAKLPIIQGGMAIRISTARLAAAVAESGGTVQVEKPDRSGYEAREGGFSLCGRNASWTNPQIR